MLYVKNKIDGLKYSQLMSYAINRCDVLTYRVKNYNKIMVGDHNLNMFPGHIIGDIIDVEVVRNIREDNIYELDVISLFQNAANKYCIKRYEDHEYFSSNAGHMSEIYVLQINPSIMSLLSSVDSIYDWIPPRMPEDLCFFSKGECWLKSESHSNSCWIYSDRSDRIERRLLRQIGVRFHESHDDIAPPSLHYSIEF
jgi:hypothetical protein